MNSWTICLWGPSCVWCINAWRNAGRWRWGFWGALCSITDKEPRKKSAEPFLLSWVCSPECSPSYVLSTRDPKSGRSPALGLQLNLGICESIYPQIGWLTKTHIRLKTMLVGLHDQFWWGGGKYLVTWLNTVEWGNRWPYCLSSFLESC